MKPRSNNKGCSDKLEKSVSADKDLIKDNEERIDEEINLISSQTDDTEDELDEEEDDKRLKEN